MFPQVAQKVATAVFNMRVRFFNIAQNVANRLGYFCYKFCRQELSKITQSGHTGYEETEENDSLNKRLCFVRVV